MRNVAFLVLGGFLILIQGDLYRIISRLQDYGSTPSLLLPLVVFLGVHESSMARGALLACALGYVVDLFASAPIGLFTFVYVAIWWLARVLGVRLTAQTLLTKFTLIFAFAIVESLVVLILLAIFGADPQRPREISRVILPHALSTALFAPLVLRLAERLHQGALVSKASAEGGSS
jgi:rod shape-determining protein MreD